MTIDRRQLITGLISLAVAPAIVRIENIMPVKLIIPEATFIVKMTGTILTVNEIIGELHIGDIVGQRHDQALYVSGFDGRNWHFSNEKPMAMPLARAA